MIDYRNKPPLVSVCSVVFNHEKFVRQAMDGFLSQQTSFPIEILVHDDVSTDNTVEILKGYQATHPDLVHLFLQTENQYSLGNDVYSFLYNNARGKYIAFCEGDDFWTDPKKLQLQADLLEENIEASGCFHSAHDLDDYSNTIEKDYWAPPARKPSYSIDDLLPRLTFAKTCTFMIRKECMQRVPNWGASVPHGDFGYLAVALLMAPMLYIDKPMAVYRRHGGSIHSANYGSVADFRALKTLINVGRTLGLVDRDSYDEGIRWRLEQLECSISRDKILLDQATVDIDNLRTSYASVRRSRAFRIGSSLVRLRQRLLGGVV
jgi:glycosyltransferase involved in cell wall biosynthesis